jgi:hypothetical protein
VAVPALPTEDLFVYVNVLIHDLLTAGARDWGRLFPVLPHQSGANRRTRWL